MGTIKTYDDEHGRWMDNPPKIWNRAEWTQDIPPDSGVWFGSLWSPNYVAKGTIFTRSVANMPLAPNSAALAQYMWTSSPDTSAGGWGDRTSLNTWAYNIPTYVVDSSKPGCEYMTIVGSAALPGGTAIQQQAYLDGEVPMPSWVEIPGGGDKAIAVYDLHTGIMREYFGCTNNGNGTLTVGSGGFYHAKRGLADLATTNYAMQLSVGLSSVVGMLNPLSQIGIAEAREGYIRHAVSFTIANSKRGVTSWPARLNDGEEDLEDAVAEGQWFRIPPSVNIDAGPWKPFTKLIMKACQEFGGYAADKNLWCHAFNTEHGAVEKHWRGIDPWSAQGGIPALYGGSLSVSDFPWDITEWAPVDWGKP